MRGFIAALSLAMIAGCEEPRFEGEIDAYAPACNNRPYVTAGFDGFTVRCGEYFYEFRQSGEKCTARLEKNKGACTTSWHDSGCTDDIIDYWSIFCLERDEQGEEISRSSSYSMPAAQEQAQEYSDTLGNIGADAAREKWLEWKSE